MKRVMVYSHDTFGLGNIRRMLAVCEALIERFTDLSILLVTGSPVIHSLRLPPRLDYIKLPCLTRNGRNEYAAKYIETSTRDIIRLRAELIRAAAASFKPDLLLVDKKPLGVKSELRATMDYLRETQPQTQSILILRDILDSPAATVSAWQQGDFHELIHDYIDSVLILGTPEIFDAVRQYSFPALTRAKVRYCGYVRRKSGQRTREAIRRELRLCEHDKLVLVTPGGGQDGYEIIRNYLTGLNDALTTECFHSLIITGPEMPEPLRAALRKQVGDNRHITLLEYTDDQMSYLNAADVVVSMGGYNTICEILSLQKRAVVIPRCRPVEEQWIRAQCLARLDLFAAIHPDELTPQRLLNQVLAELHESSSPRFAASVIDLDALPEIADFVAPLLPRRIVAKLQFDSMFSAMMRLPEGVAVPA